ncbi:CapA family protein [Cohnella pontilimi]|uniref:CapA family protein n=1 Tax=Cohnella pontilimi TaxID=2564100 RepID=A0A4U0FFC2_9BACL|nr:CapA family protein [Cohnella pontilimi]TJY43528.1 CapA family protein [Cohnella pontilimi]
MSYSRSETHRDRKSRSQRRIRRLIALNSILLVAVAIVVVWLFVGSNPKQSGLEADAASAPPSKAAHTPASPAAKPSPPVESPAPSASAGTGADSEFTPVKLAFVGDILPAASVAQLMKKNGYDYPYREAQSLLQAADITAGNLEAPITGRGTPAGNKQYLFRGPAEALPALKDAGFDVFTLANNHTLDYGWVGLQDTMDALNDHGLKHVGAGTDATEAYTPVYMESKGITVAYIGISRVLPEPSWKAAARHPGVADGYNPAGAEKAIRDAKKNADLVVVLVHWGIERADQPNKDQKELGHRLIDAGADLVVGSHPHVLQGFEFYKNKWIAYSLGNFVFNTTASPKTSETGILTAACSKTGSCSLEFQPMKAVNSQPAPLTGQAAKELLARLSSLSTAAVFKENGQLVAKH